MRRAWPLWKSRFGASFVLLGIAVLSCWSSAAHRSHGEEGNAANVKTEPAPKQVPQPAEPPQSCAGNRLTYLDDFCEPYYVHREFPKLVTPQWVGEEGVECVVTLGIDDMRSVDGYESFLRPILERLKKIDGRAPVSVMTNDVDPQHPHLQTWLKEGVSIETHTIDHPCPCLQQGSFEQAKSTYDRCVDKMATIPGSHPVAFRFPCCDSLNTPSPRAFAEIVNSVTPAGNFLHISTSVCSLLTPDDPDLPREIVFDADGRERFAKYLPFPSFVNKVENYPYPFVVGRSCWEFPIAVPDDWQGQHLHAANNPKTVEDLIAYFDGVTKKQGMMNVVFHPHAWIRSEQMVQFIAHTQRAQGDKVKFLNFRECLERLNKNLLAGESLRSANGEDDGVRLVDLNGDGYLDVVIGNDRKRLTRVWSPERRGWIEAEFPARLVTTGSEGRRVATGVRFGIVGDSAQPVCLVNCGEHRGAWRWSGEKWIAENQLLAGLEIEGQPIFTCKDGRDCGVRLRDLDGDGCCELLVGNAEQNAVFAWNAAQQSWSRLPFTLPEGLRFVDRAGRDAGLRLIDVDEDGYNDLVFSNHQHYAVCAFAGMQQGWSRELRRGLRGEADQGKAVPMIARAGTNNGAWFARGHLWVQNEDTHRLPDGVERASFVELQGDVQPMPKAPEMSRATIRVSPGNKVDLVAAEPLTMDPVNFDWGPDGKFWVVEMSDYPLGLDGKGKPGGRVRYLEDTDGDGRYDKSTLFLDGIAFPTGVMAWRGGVLVSAAPDIFYAADTDGDGRADKREVLYTGFGQGNQQHRVNGFCRGLDNWIYIANGDSGGKIRSTKTGQEVDISGRDLRIRPDDGAMEAQIGLTQFGRSRDDWGNWFGCNNSLPVMHFVLDDRYLRRNPHAAPPAPRLDLATLESAPIYPIGRVLSHFVGYQPPAAGQPSRFTSANSVVVYRDNLLGPAYTGSAFVSEPVHSLVHREVLSPKGVTFTAAPANQPTREEFFAASDPWCRPTTIRTGPDGGLWIADMYRLVIEHPEWIDDALEKAIDLRAGHDRGRIYRVVPARGDLRPIPRLDRLDVAGVVALLESPNGTTRDLAQQWIVEHRNEPQVTSAAVPLLEQKAKSSHRPLGRLHALCTLAGLDALQPGVVALATSDEHPGVRRHAVRLSEQFLGKSAPVADAVLARLADSDPHVQLQLAYSLGEWDDPRAGKALGQMALAKRDDAYLLGAVMSSVGERNVGEVLASVLSGQDVAAPATELLERLFVLSAAIGNDQAAKRAMAAIVSAPRDGKFASSQLSAIAGAREALARRNVAIDTITDDAIRAQLAELFDHARKVAVQNDAAEAERLAAIRLLTSGPAEQADVELLVKLLAPQNPPPIQAAVVTALSDANRDDVPEKLLADWPTHSPTIRSQILDTLVGREAWVGGLLAAIERGTLRPADLDATRSQRLRSLDNAELRARAAALLAAGTPSRQQVLKDHQDVLQVAGNSATGKVVFAKRCAGCHRLEDVGVDVGANLQAVGNRSPEALLVAILDPNQAVEDRYREYVVATDDGRTATGVIVNETGASITLRGQEAKERVILRKEIESLRSSGKSLMPEGFEKDLGKQDLADLIAYVASQGPPPKQFDGNQPAVVHADASGNLFLSASQCKIYGNTLVYEPQHHNLGFWQSENDRAVWEFEAPIDGHYQIVLDFACHDDSQGNAFVLQVGGHRLAGKIPGTGSWENYSDLAAGQLELTAGPHQLMFRAQGPMQNCLVDLRAVRLLPAGKAAQ